MVGKMIMVATPGSRIAELLQSTWRKAETTDWPRTGPSSAMEVQLKADPLALPCLSKGREIVLRASQLSGSYLYTAAKI